MKAILAVRDAALSEADAGDYEGLREFEGVPMQSIYREYARAVACGRVEYYGGR